MTVWKESQKALVYLRFSLQSLDHAASCAAPENLYLTVFVGPYISQTEHHTPGEGTVPGAVVVTGEGPLCRSHAAQHTTGAVGSPWEGSYCSHPEWGNTQMGRRQRGSSRVAIDACSRYFRRLCAVPRTWLNVQSIFTGNELT